MSQSEAMGRLIMYVRQFQSEEASAAKPVLWLGAGCSVFDGIPLNRDLLSGALGDQPDAWGSLQYRFDQFCDLLGATNARARYLTPFFERPINEDSPYHGLARLLRTGYVDMAFTFNIDDLLEQALAAAGMTEGRDFAVIKVPETVPHAVAGRVESPGTPRIRVVKLHGDYRYGFNYMTSREIVAYDDGIRDLVKRYSSRAAIVCGYSFFHLNVLTAFSQSEAPFFYVNRSFPDAPMVLSLMAARSKAPNFIDAPLGSFDQFVIALIAGLGI